MRKLFAKDSARALVASLLSILIGLTVAKKK